MPMSNKRCIFFIFDDEKSILDKKQLKFFALNFFTDFDVPKMPSA